MAKSSFLKKLTGSKKKKKKEKDKPAKKAKKLKKKVKKTKKVKPTTGQLGIDLYQTEDDLILKATIAGIKPSDLDIEITNEMVTIRGQRQSSEGVRGDNYYYQECYWGSFSRSLVLPVEVNADKSSAALKDGILTIKMPKLSKSQGKKLEVKI